MPFYHASIPVVFDTPDEPTARQKLVKLEADIKVAARTYYSISLVGPVAFGPATPAKATPKPSTPAKGGFHMPHVRKRDDMGGLLGGD